MPIRAIVPEDRYEITNILHRSETFSEREIEIALELFDIHFEDPEEDYEFYVSIDERNRVLGYVCISPTPLTEGAWDIYWLVIRPDAQGQGVGRELVDFLENRIRSAQGRLVVAETSSTEAYSNARRFYLKHGYRELANIHDYYSTDDHLIIYGKYL